MPDPQDPAIQAENTPAVAEPAPPAPPADEPNNQPVPAANGDEGAQNGAVGTPGDEGAPAPSDSQPGPSRQERRNEERESRIRELTRQVKQGQQSNQPAPGYQQSPQPFDVRKYADQDGNLDEDATNQAFQQSVVQTADAIASLRVEQQLAHRDAVHNFERDSENLPTKFKELDPNSDVYTEDLDAAIAQDYQERAFKPVINPQTGAPFVNPDGTPVLQLDTRVRLADIAERHVKSARSLANKLNANTNNAVDAAADSAAPRPTPAKPSESSVENMSTEELRAKIGYHRT